MPVIDLLTRLNADTAVQRERLTTLTQQVSTGRRSDRLGDLALQLPRAVDLKAEIGRRTVYGSAIGQALANATATQQALTQLGDVAATFANDTAFNLNPGDPAGIAAAADRARAALQQVAQVLNTRQAGQYVFGGSDLGNPPIPDPANIATSGFATQIAAAVAGLGGGNAAAVAAATLAAASSDAAGTTPFSAFLSDPARGLAEPARSVPTDEGQAVGYGVAANRNARAISTGATTGSWARDLLRGLASLAALTPAQAASPADFSALAATIRNGFKAAENGLADEAGALGQTEARLAAAQTRQTALTTSLQAQVSDLQDVDLAATLTRLQGTQTSLQASYSAIGQLANLTLAQFLK